MKVKKLHSTLRTDEPGYTVHLKCGCVLTLVKHDRETKESIIKMDWSRCEDSDAVRAKGTRA